MHQEEEEVPKELRELLRAQLEALHANAGRLDFLAEITPVLVDILVRHGASRKKATRISIDFLAEASKRLHAISQPQEEDEENQDTSE